MDHQRQFRTFMSASHAALLMTDAGAAGGGGYVYVNRQAEYSSGSATTLALPAQSLTTGNNIFVHVVTYSAATATVSDTAGNTYTALTRLSGTGPTVSQWFYKLNATGHAANVVTVTWSVAQTFRWAESVQFSKSGAAFDVEQATGTATGTTVTSGSFSTTAAGLILAGRSVFNGQTASSFNQSLTWIDPGTTGAGNLANLQYGSIGYRITTGALSSITVTETGNSSTNRALCIACFK
jgi:hypothetical protein